MLTKFLRSPAAFRRSFCSSVVSTFNGRPPRASGNFIQRATGNSGLFGIPELTSSEGFRVLRREAEERTNELVKEALAPQRSRKLVSIFDELSDTLCRVADMADCMRLLHPDARYRKEAEDACSALMRLVEELNTNASLYTALKAVVEAKGEPEFATDKVDHRVAELLLADFELSGIHLDSDRRQKFVTANETAFSIGAHFMQATGFPRRLKKSLVANALKEDFYNNFSDSGDNDHFMVSSALSLSPNHLTREMGYRVFYFPDPNQEELLRALLETRHNLAELTGFEKFSDRATRHTMAGSADKVMNFLNTLHEQLPLTAELELLRRLKKEFAPRDDDKELKMWDIPFLIRQARVKMLGMEQEALSKYFTLGNCMEALRMLCKELFGVNFRVVEPAPGELWHRDVFKVELEHEDEGPLGLVYMDLFERPGKPTHDCHYTIRGGRQLSGSYQQPIVTLHLNVSPPSSNAPSRLAISEVENIFHEFGHALHSMLGRTRYQHVTGTRTSTDFAEVPSTLMESFALDSRVLERFAKHYKTNEVLPKEIISKVQSSRSLLVGVEVRQHVMYAALDQILHGCQPLPGTPSEVMRIMHNAYFPVPFVEQTAWHQRFSHLIGYGAKYYSYLMARSVAQRLWNDCFVEDPFSRASGERYRREMLAFGGERPPSELFYNLTGDQLTTDAMAEGLINTIGGSSDQMARNYLTGL